MRPTNYFQYFNFTISNDTIIRNLLNRAKIIDMDIVLKTKLYTPYFIKDGERPETIAETYYGSTAYFWIILFTNNIENIYEGWPRTQEALDEYITYKYRTLEEANLKIHHYEDGEGNWIISSEWDNWITLINSNNGEMTGIDYTIEGITEISCYDYEVNLNEEKRIINLIRPQYLSQIVEEFQNIFK
jgi:hypothetical protein